MAPPIDPRAEGVDPLENRLAVARGQSAPSDPWEAPRTYLALGTSVVPRPGVMLLVAGMILGPAALNVLPEPFLTAIDPGVSVALAALGVFVGLGLRPPVRDEARLLLAATLQASVTFLVVTAALLGAMVTASDGPTSAWIAVFAGLCAAVSSTAVPRSDETTGTRIGDLDDVLPIVVGGFAMVALHVGAPARVAVLTLAGAAVAIAAAMAGWLLVGRAATESEQRTYLAGALLLAGGTAAYASQSALMLGLVAGILWNVLGGEARDRMERDLQLLQHPLVALVLLVAGARVSLSAAAVALAAIYVAARLAGKLAGGWLAWRSVRRVRTTGAALSLVPPGATGIAFALNVLQIDADAARAGTLLAVVVCGSFASELVSLTTFRRRSA